MCGIFATTGSVETNKMNQILESMKHRGPDEGKHVPLNGFHIGHQRLSIIGLEDGIQPIPNEDQSKWIVCNGEIYNYVELKQSLANKVSFSTHSDSEVALKLIETEGVKGIEKLDGMFAFVIVDERKDTFVAARDTLGIKPLYYGKDEQGNYVFSSELKTLYLVTDDVQEFPPGTYYTPETGFVKYRRVQQPSEIKQSSREGMTASIRHHLEEAVEKRLLADVEVGVLLSGGLDSSLISAIAAKKAKSEGRTIKSFCVGSEGSEDIERARDVAEAIGSEHYEYIYTQEELVEAIPHVVYALESYEPSLVRSAIPNYFVSKLAAQHVKVILSGEGADELFAGYDYMKQFQTTESLNEEIIRIINTLHNINLQRGDRMSMAHSLELRVPFLDLDLIETALQIPAGQKLHTEEQMEKTILRESFDGVLPDSVLWRKKEEFSAGSGALDLLETYANETISDDELAQLQDQAPVSIRSKQEALFYRYFVQYFPEQSALETVGKWATA
ncbi:MULTISPECIES: asparagine synthase B [Pontibacillus]|uniref:asparagine synthase (glutamine-hydrolyzing) n=1 Tax=Pontibacillus chungwhensis TaxID=265426 RepID=A0ABY8UWZ6_9BACI|nr:MULTISPECIES: asparagine synthase B [Pontibacillus]MCD5325730.1 asparagine synthase B [Pontibacillus sp. HN14]WIF98032.1 asparagine synthase B [Pontibacillus chungwhensis]